MPLRAFLIVLVAAAFAGCGGSQLVSGSATPPVPSRPVAAALAVDTLDGVATCRVSGEGAVWYTVARGSFSPLVANHSDCAGGTLGAVAAPVPAWAIPRGATQARFAAASLARGDAVDPLAATLHAAGVPVTWLVAAPPSAALAAALDAAHGAGDDVETSPATVATARALWPWFTPSVGVLGAGRERDIAGTLASGATAFWGITWNSHGVDGTADEGAPWGLFCADPSSYKRPAPIVAGAACPLASIEWTARDLTATYASNREDAYSTDPEDLRLRAALDPFTAAAYARQLVDAYAAAGETAPLLMVAQEESDEFAAASAADAPIETALATQATRDGMRTVTFAQALAQLAPSATAPRAVAFPALALSGVFGPATIDAHDAHVGLTFRAGNLMPDRVVAYDRATSSVFDRPLPQLAPQEMPVLLGASAANGSLALHFRAPVATRFAVAFWSDPALMGWSDPAVVPAGRAGAVAFFDLGAGDNVVTLHCTACTTTTFPYST